ncbi:MAG: DUF5130 family protein [Nocardioidaceae bacterium]
MPAGDAFTASERHEIDKAIRDAETVSRFEFSVFVGTSEGETGPFARRLHSALTAPDRSVLVMVDPAARILEIVTGKDVRRHLTDSEVRLAAIAMETDFAVGNLAAGICNGLHLLSEHARSHEMLHVTEDTHS